MELTTYTKAQINNNISKLLEEGKSNDDALHFFLKMKMVNDLGPERPFITKAPSPAEVKIHLLGYDDIPQDDVILELPNQAKNNTQRLVFKLSPAYALYVEKVHDSLQVTVNGKNLTAMYLKTFRAADIALWMIRQRHKLDKYIEEWDSVLDLACKKSKLDRMAFLKIRAIFTEAMKDYPRLKYVPQHRCRGLHRCLVGILRGKAPPADRKSETAARRSSQELLKEFLCSSLIFYLFTFLLLQLCQYRLIFQN